ncbi:acetyltransferase, GNAT family domain protein [Burkholderia mallei]|nr:acetyltransferase, GNAT family domain protein [Burkholderia mallei]
MPPPARVSRLYPLARIRSPGPRARCVPRLARPRREPARAAERSIAVIRRCADLPISRFAHPPRRFADQPVSRSGAPAREARASAPRGRHAVASHLIVAPHRPISSAAAHPLTPTPRAMRVYFFAVGRLHRPAHPRRTTRRTPRTARTDDARRRLPSGLSESRPPAGFLDLLLPRTQIP